MRLRETDVLACLGAGFAIVFSEREIGETTSVARAIVAAMATTAPGARSTAITANFDIVMCASTSGELRVGSFDGSHRGIGNRGRSSRWRQRTAAAVRPDS